MTFHVSKKPPNRRIYIRPIYGDCLERIGVKNNGGGYAIIDTNATVRVGDLVFCSRVLGEIGHYIKQVKEINGDSIIVGTAYLDEARDFQFEAAEIMGTVIETYGKYSGFREYVRPTRSRKSDETGAIYAAPFQLSINDNTCVCCGKIIPEGRQICPKCEDITDKNIKSNNFEFKSNKEIDQ